MYKNEVLPEPHGLIGRH